MANSTQFKQHETEGKRRKEREGKRREENRGYRAYACSPLLYGIRAMVGDSRRVCGGAGGVSTVSRRAVSFLD